MASLYRMRTWRIALMGVSLICKLEWTRPARRGRVPALFDHVEIAAFEDAGVTSVADLLAGQGEFVKPWKGRLLVGGALAFTLCKVTPY